MTKALLLSWDWRPEVLVILITLALVYVRGWLRLRRKTRAEGQRTRWAAGWRLATYWLGLASIGVSLMSPIDVLSGQLFFLHMTQHLLLSMAAVPLMLIGDPFPVLMWGLPAAARRPVTALLNDRSPWRRMLARLTTPGISWLAYVTVLIGWHDPTLYDLALRNNAVHDIQHLCFFFTTALLWWHVLGCAPRLHRSLSIGQRIIYTISVVPVNMIIGVVIAFAPQPVYPYYANVPRITSLSVMQDQMIAGILMWIPGSEMFFWAALLVLTHVIANEAKKPVQTNPAWSPGDVHV